MAVSGRAIRQPRASHEPDDAVNISISNFILLKTSKQSGQNIHAYARMFGICFTIQEIQAKYLTLRLFQRVADREDGSGRVE